MRFNTLDGLRGFAAILVLFYHLGAHAPIAVPAGYLAVDLFFALSGFVIARAYDARLKAGMTLGEFALVRLVRVYPMAFVGAAIGVLLSHGFLPSLLLLPDLAGIGEAGPLYPANAPLWSLALELLVNLGFGIVAVRAGWRGLAIALVTSATVMVLGASQYRLADIGAFWETAGYGIARTTFSFALGVAMQRLHVRFAIRRKETYLAWLLPVALSALLMTLPADRLGWDLASVFLLLPAILWLGTTWEAPRARLFVELGGLSFPLYCIHGVVIQGFVGAGAVPAYLWLVLIAAAWWLNSRIDVPLRGAIMVRLQRRRTAPERYPQAL